MPEITNLSPGPRILNVKAGNGQDGLPIVKQATLLPGETKMLDVVDMSHPMIFGMIETGQLAVDAAGKKAAEAEAQTVANNAAIEAEVQRRLDAIMTLQQKPPEPPKK
jgi:hypothetical protein